MAETNGSPQKNHSLQSLFHALDPISLILSQNTSNSHQPVPLRLTTENFYTMERGPRYKAYADLRESRLRLRNMKQHQETEEQQQQEYKPNPLKKQVKFQESLSMKRRGSSSVLTQSVPDFSATLRKENRKPTSTLPSVMELTPPMKKYNGVLSSSRGSKSASAGEKRGLLMARKSYASVEELKGLATAAGGAINAENRGGRSGRGGVGGKTVLGYRQF